MDYGEKPLPSNPEAERVILGAILLDNSLIFSVAKQLKANDFYNAMHVRIYKAMLILLNKKETIDPILIATELRKIGQLENIGGIVAINNLTYGLPHFSNVESYIKLVKESAVIRQTVKICQQTIGECLDESEDATIILERHEKGLLDIRKVSNFGETSSTLAQLVQESADHFVKVRKGETIPNGMTTGFKSWDALTGGLHRTDLTIIAGRTSMGKSACVYDIARNVCKEDSARVVVIFSPEMSKQQITNRMICAEGLIDGSAFRNALLTGNEVASLERSIQTLAEYKIIIDDRPSPSMFEVEAKLREVEQKYKRVDLIIADHAGKFKTTKSNNRSEDLGEISGGFKDLAKTFNCSSILLSQLSRNCEKRNPPKPIMSDLYESGRLEQDADQVIFIYRDEYYNPSSAEQGVAEINIAKNRNSPTGRFKLVFKKSSATFRGYQGI